MDAVSRDLKLYGGTRTRESIHCVCGTLSQTNQLRPPVSVYLPHICKVILKLRCHIINSSLTLSCQFSLAIFLAVFLSSMHASIPSGRKFVFLTSSSVHQRVEYANRFQRCADAVLTRQWQRGRLSDARHRPRS